MGIQTPTFEYDWLKELSERTSMFERFEDLTMYDMEKLDNLKKSFKVYQNTPGDFNNYCCNQKTNNCKGCKNM